MKVKSGVIYNGLQTILDFTEKTMPIKLAAKMLRLADDLTKENEFINKQKRQIIEKYGEKDENDQLIFNEDGSVKFKDVEDMNKAQNELNELADLDVEITDREITEEELENANVEVSMKQLVILKEFLHKDKE